MLRACIHLPNFGEFVYTLVSTYKSMYSNLRPGRKLIRVRKVLEQKVLLQCGNRSSVCDYYQSPLLDHFASPHYPPLYSRNIERKVGDTSIGVGQLSLNSLWPIMLMEVDTRGKQGGATTVSQVYSFTITCSSRADIFPFMLILSFQFCALVVYPDSL